MSRRRLVLPAGLAAGLIVCTGCQSRVESRRVAGAAESAAGTAAGLRRRSPSPPAATGATGEPAAGRRPSRPGRHCGFHPRRLR